MKGGGGGGASFLDGEKSFQSVSNDGNSVMTTFFRARSSPVKYVKEVRPEILKCDDFQLFMTKYRKQKYYVDKSLWIKEVLDRDDRIQVYSKPCDMGKSLNLSMLHKFLDNKQNKYKVDELFDNLEIKQHSSLCLNH